MDEDGFLRSASGREVPAGVAVSLLTDVSPGDAMSKGLVPASYHRPFVRGRRERLTGEHGTAGYCPDAPASHPAEPQSFDRPWIGRAITQAPSPDDRAPTPNMPGARASAVYAAGERAYAENQRMARADRVMPSAAVMRAPSPARWSMPADMRSSDVPADLAMGATRPSPGEVTR